MQSGHNELLGKTAKDRARVENIVGVLNDAMKDITALCFNKEYNTAKGAALEKAKVKLNDI